MASCTKDTKMLDPELLETRLQAEADAFCARTRCHQRYIVFDVEYKFDWEGQNRANRHAACAADEADNDNGDPKFKVRWPFHRISCIAAMVVSVSASGILAVEAFETWSRPEMTEADIVRAFAAFVAARDDAIPTTWGGENKDLPAILSIAMRAGLALPAALAGAHWKRRRIDLCPLLSGKAEQPHLNEIAHSQGLPAKLFAPKALGKAAEKGRWTAVREHCECDVTITAMLLARWLLTTGQIQGSRLAIDSVIVDAVAQFRHYRPRLMEAIGGFVTPALDQAA